MTSGNGDDLASEEDVNQAYSGLRDSTAGNFDFDNRAQGRSPRGGALALLKLPYVFSQDGLLTAGDFVRAAKDRGHSLSLALLQELHNFRTLVPLYRVSDVPVTGRRIDVEQGNSMNVRGWTLQAAAEGRLRDSSDEGYSAAWPYVRPSGENARRWWNGFIYSTWQLLDVGAATSDYESIRRGWQLVSTSDDQRTTLVMLIDGHFSVKSTEGAATFLKPGEYVMWSPGVDHAWRAVADSIMLTARWPSSSQD